MEENKYYVPEIEEFHVGFEYEYHEHFGKDFGKWNTYVFNRESVIRHLIDLMASGSIRVKYLDHDDIIELGFEPSFDEPDEWFHGFNGNPEIQLYFDDKVRKNNQGIGITIHKYNDVPFSGFVKNKSELKLIIKQLDLYNLNN